MYLPSNFNTTTNVWTDSTTNGRNVTGTGSFIVTNSTTGNGNTKTFQILTGTTSSSIELVSSTSPLPNYTLFHVSRAPNTISAIFTGPGLLSGYWNLQSGLCFFGGWIGPEKNRCENKWFLSTNYNKTYKCNGTLIGNGGGVVSNLPVPFGINLGSNWGTNATANFEIAEIIIYNTVLTDAQIVSIESTLINKYGINYTVTVT